MFPSWWLSKGGRLLQGSNESAATAPLRTSCGYVCDGPAPVRAIHTLECSIFTAQIFSLVIIASSGDLKWPGLVTSSWCLQGEEGKRQTRPEGILKDGGDPCVLLYFLSRTKEPPCLSLASCLSCVNKSEASTSYSEGAENSQGSAPKHPSRIWGSARGGVDWGGSHPCGVNSVSPRPLLPSPFLCSFLIFFFSFSVPLHVQQKIRLWS